MNGSRTGIAQNGLDWERLVTTSWKVFMTRPLTLVGVSILVQVLWLPTHVFALTSIYWLPFTLCIPYASLLLLHGEKSDRIYLGWIRYYTRTLAIFAIPALAFILLFALSSFVGFLVRDIFTSDPTTRIRYVLYLGRFAPAVLVEAMLSYMFGLVALLSIRHNLAVTEAMTVVLGTKRRFLEAFLLASTLTLFGFSGFLLCCVGVFATTTFSWICLGVAYKQMFEE